MAYNIADLFEHAVDAVPDRVAVVVDDQPMTFAELEDRANRFAHYLVAHDFGPGDHIGIYATNSRQWIEAMLGTFKIRAVPINVNYRYVADELLYLLDTADLTALVFDRDLAPLVAAVAGKAHKLRHLVHLAGHDGDRRADGPDMQDGHDGLDSIDFEDALATTRPKRDFPPRSDDDLYVLYTGGTTGMPKGVMWRHQDVFMALGGGSDAYTNEPVTSEHQLADKARSIQAPLVSLCLPPLMHGAAQWSVLRFLFDGSTTVLSRRFDPHGSWWLIDRWKVNNVTMTGDAMARPLIEALEDIDATDGPAPDLSSLFVFVSAGVLFSSPVKDRFLARLPDVLLVDAIGSTETGVNGLMTVRPGATEMRGGPTVRPGRDAVVLGEDLRPLAPGGPEPGRLARKGNVPIGYYKDEVRTAATCVTGPDGERYVLAGDMARLEADGSITLLGRGSQCVNTGGEKVFPEEVEDTLKAHPAVFDAVVVGVDDERWGQRVAAVVELRPQHADLTLEELDTHCRSRLAGYKIPRQLTIVDNVVRSPSGKPDYPWAQRVAAAASATSSST